MTKSEVCEFFKGKTILITGGSGFIGRALVEKLLYSCSDVEEIFLLMRPKQQESAEERFKKLLNSSIFDRIKNRPELLSIITLIRGDVRRENIDLSDEHLRLITSTTNIVFHLAASINMSLPLKSSIEANLISTKNVLDLCKKMTNLRVVLHLSTAFCNSDREVSDEVVYDWPLNPKNLIDCTDDEIKFLEDKIINYFPNFYIFTKRMAEILVRNEFNEGQLNACIVRPSIVTPSWRETTPGWINSENGLLVALAATGKGLIRTMMCEGSFHTPLIPVDQAVAGIIAIAHSVGSQQRKFSVLNVSFSEGKLLNNEMLLRKLLRISKTYPLKPGLWYPNSNLTMNPFTFYLTMILTMWLPALLIDFIMLITFQRRFMIRIQRKIFAAHLATRYFSTRDWIFKTENFKEVFQKLSKEEQKVFNFNTEEVDIDEYFRNCVIVGRTKCLKEPPETIPKCRIYLKIQFAVDLLLKAFQIYFLGNWLLSFINCNKSLATFITSVLIIFFMFNNFYENYLCT